MCIRDRYPDNKCLHLWAYQELALQSIFPLRDEMLCSVLDPKWTSHSFVSTHEVELLHSQILRWNDDNTSKDLRKIWAPSDFGVSASSVRQQPFLAELQHQPQSVHALINLLVAKTNNTSSCVTSVRPCVIGQRFLEVVWDDRQSPG